MNKQLFEKEINDNLKKANIDSYGENILARINGLPNGIEVDKGEEQCDMYVPYVVRYDHESSKPDSYIAMYGYKTKYGISDRNYLFLVCASSAQEVLAKFFCAYHELEKMKVIRELKWTSSYKRLNLFVSAKDIENSKWFRGL